MSNSSNFYITTGISYPNGPPHIGHAYEVIVTDVIARFMRLAGRKVFFLTGTDDHGQKMYRTAREQKIEPQALADALVPKFREMGERYLCSFDGFIRTSEPRHHEAVQALWRKLHEAGDIFSKTYEGWYSVRDENYVSEDDVVVQADGTATDKTGQALERLSEPCYHFRLSAWQTRLLAFYDEHPDFLQPPAARNEILAFLRRGLKDIAVSRSSFAWGVQVPDDAKHIVYVWLDALTNYITGVGYPADNEKWRDFWPASLHVIGKDITRFHGIFWLAFLMAAGLPVPRQILAHGFLTVGGEKMSKSVGNVIDPMDLLAAYGAEAVRFFLVREIPLGRDGQISEAALTTRYNADLANDLGNLAQRCLTMVQKNCGGAVAVPAGMTGEEDALLARTDALGAHTAALMRDYDLHRYLEEVMGVVGECNRYFAAAQPWKQDAERQSAILYVTAECLRQLAILLSPVLPESMERLLDYLGIAKAARDFAALGERLAPSTLPPPQPLFPRKLARETQSREAQPRETKSRNAHARGAPPREAQ